MATKNFSFMGKKLLISIIAMAILVGCQHQQTETDEFPEDNLPSQNAGDSSKPNYTPEAPAGSFIKKKAPKLGVILGGGGVLTYAQIGVLRELIAQKISVHAIVGLEWGALVAATYSLNGQAHEAEWQLLKMPYKKFHTSGVFSSEKPVSVDKFSNFLQQIFKDKKVNNGSVAFSCPYIDTRKGRIRMAKKGSYKDALKMCWPYAPLFNYQAQMACPLAIREAVGHLRSKGAEIILYVDVLDKNLLFTTKQRQKYPSGNLMWLQAKTMAGGLKQLGVDEVISVPLGASNYLAYESMRLLVRMGQMKSRNLLKQFAKKYEY